MNKSLLLKISLIILMMLLVLLNAKDFTEVKTDLSDNNEFLTFDSNDNLVTDYYNISPHNLSASKLQDIDQSENCVVCHSKNNEEKSSLLWGKSLSSTSIKTNAEYDMMVSSTSLKCLGCHDGATALNTIPNGTIGYSTISSKNDFGSNINNKYNYRSYELGNNHPVGIIYDEFNTALNAIADLKIAKLEPGTNRITCATCHEHHNSTNKSSVMTFSNVGSSLCLDCHKK